ncbi:MAG: hypothetical protein U1F57_10230 [bacterium]
MNFLRRPFVIAFFFLLISVGQGHSLAYIARLAREGVSPDKISQSLSENGERKQENPLLVCGSGWTKQLRANPFPARSHEETAPFQGDPFLPSLYSFHPPHLNASLIPDPCLHGDSASWLPDLPPPKQAA